MSPVIWSDGAVVGDITVEFRQSHRDIHGVSSDIPYVLRTLVSVDCVVAYCGELRVHPDNLWIYLCNMLSSRSSYSSDVS